MCANGHPTVAVMRLLELVARAGAQLCYHGDFDWPGLQIAGGVMRRVGAAPWRFTCADYLAAEKARADIEVDLMVPERFAPAGGRRSVRLPPHDKMIARKAIGIEGSIIDNDPIEVTAFDGSDPRRFTVGVAGPSALVVAKVHKLRDRLAEGNIDRIADKDAADVYRLMLAVPASECVLRLRPLLADETAGSVCRDALSLMARLFGARAADGVRMASDALRVAVPRDQVADVCTGSSVR